MIPMRKTAQCMNCGEVREIAAHGLCFTCYRRSERRVDRSVDRHSPGIRRDDFRLVSSYCQILKALSSIGVGQADVEQVRRILAPYLEPIAPLLTIDAGAGDVEDQLHGPDEERDEIFVTSEREHE